MALQKSLTLPASTVVLKASNSWPMTFFVELHARFLPWRAIFVAPSPRLSP